MKKAIKQTANTILIRTVVSLVILIFGMILTLSLFEQPGPVQASLPQTQLRLQTAKQVNIYDLTAEGLFVKAGQTWQKLENVPEQPVSIAVAPTNPKLFYIGTASSGFYRSQDGGQHWQLISPPNWNIPGVALRGTAIAIDERNVNHIAVATAYSIGKRLTGDAVYESYNAGQSWRKLADTEEVIERLVIEDGVTMAMTKKGLVQYGSPAESRPFFEPTVRENPY